MTIKTVNAAYVFLTLVAVVLTWEIHEFAHWLAGRILGYQMAMTLNKSYSLQSTTARHAQIISAAGPLITLAEAALVFVLMRHTNRRLLYPFLFTCFYCRLLAALVSFRNLNDEARISKFLGIGTFTLPLMITTVLFFLVRKISGEYSFNKKFKAITLGLVILFSSLLILSDQFFPSVFCKGFGKNLQTHLK